jgi:hypothetical protein
MPRARTRAEGEKYNFYFAAETRGRIMGIIRPGFPPNYRDNFYALSTSQPIELLGTPHRRRSGHLVYLDVETGEILDAPQRSEP